MFPREANSLYLLKNSLYLLKNQHLKVIYCNKNIGVTSCRCLKVLWSVLKASRCPLGSLTKASWTVKNGSKPIPESTQIGFLCDTSLKNRFFNNMLPKHRLVTSSWCLEALWSASKASWSHLERPRNPSWVLQNLISAGQRASKKTTSIFPGCKKQVLWIYRIATIF